MHFRHSFISAERREKRAIHRVLTRLGHEWTAGLPGGVLAAEHLAQFLFIEVIRAWLGSADAPVTGWLCAIGERRLGEAIRLLHDEASRKWLLQDLAHAAGMSRSNFALRFKQLAGLSPLDYLLRWRMRLGAKELRLGGEPISAIALSLGYQSESAFSNAFKRITGMAPHQYRNSYRR